MGMSQQAPHSHSHPRFPPVQSYNSPTPSTHHYTRTGIPISTAQAVGLLLELFDTLQVSSRDVRDAIIDLRGALITNSREEMIRTELERMLRPDACISSATQAQAVFYPSISQLLASRALLIQPSGVARDAFLVITAMKTIRTVTGTAISDAHSGGKCGQPRKPNRPSTEDILLRTPIDWTLEEDNVNPDISDSSEMARADVSGPETVLITSSYSYLYKTTSAPSNITVR